MKTTVKYKGAAFDLSGRLEITFAVTSDKVGVIKQINEFDEETLLDLEVKTHRERRSLDANAMLWACLGDIAAKTGDGTWSVYLAMLKRYGKYTYISVKEEAAAAVRANWRETEIVGETEINGEPAVMMLCFFGSSTYNTAEMSRLLDGVISDMKDLGLQPPPTKDVERSFELWQHNAKR